MNRKTAAIAVVLVAVVGLAFAQDLKIDYQCDVANATPVSYLSFSGPITYMAVDKDHVDAKGAASEKNSTELFNAYRYDVKGKLTLPEGLRGMFLYSVGPAKQKTDDHLTVAKAADGVITVQFSHRGTAYQLVSDKAGKFTFPTGNYRKRAIGFIEGAGPQVIARDFSADGTAARIDWAKVWDDKVAGGKEVAAGKPAKTGTIVADGGAADAMFGWEGNLQLTFDKNILKAVGGLNVVKK
jgi:hypothetical protein